MRRLRTPWFAVGVCLLWACDDAGPAASADAHLQSDQGVDGGATLDGDLPDVGSGLTDARVPPDALVPPPGPEGAVPVYVTLDGEPAVGGFALQGGTSHRVPVGPDGWAFVPVESGVEGDQHMVASHPEARQRSAPFDPEAPEAAPVVLALGRYDPADNPDYFFQDPGTPDRRDTTAQCGHCHLTFNDDWYDSAHRTAASNPVVHDLYAGAAAAWADEATCVANGGRWQVGRLPGEARGGRCYVGMGYLPLANPGCDEGPCPAPGETGGCADCHAPGMDGVLGGRDLLEATDRAYDFGVFCDVCHRVDAVDLASEAPGVAGRLRLTRPSQPGSPSLGAGGLLPLTFGPSDDSPNPRMGSVQRDHYRNGALCGGCHELNVEVVPAAGALDAARWPSGRLPVQSTWSEWQAGPMAEAAPCPACHMPPAPEVANGADLQAFELAETGVQGGWRRPPGSARHHSWLGPRSKAKGLLRSAAAIQGVVTAEEGALVAEITVQNVGAGHAIPTGEPLRALLLTVEARCADEPLPAVGGAALPGWAGADAQISVEAPERLPALIEAWPEGWPAPEVGDEVRVTRRTGDFYAYEGPGPFAGDRLSPEEKGRPVEEVMGAVQVVAIEAGRPRLSGPVPEGHLAWLIRTQAEEDAASTPLAGASGFAFARVAADAEGREMVPHFAAVDVVSDLRLMPQQAWTSSHRFTADCAEPEVHATLWHRPWPRALAQERGWPDRDQLMATWTGRLTPSEPAPLPEPVEGEAVRFTLQPEVVDPGPGESGAARYVYQGEGFERVGTVPVIRARVGQRVEATLNNRLDAPTTVHWHGVKVPWAMDGSTWMRDPTAPGATFEYAFDLTHPGTFWFHPHFDTEGQVDRGLYGALLVDPSDLPAPGEGAQPYDELVLILDQADEARPMSANGGRSAPGHAHGHGGLQARWLINGEAAPLRYEAGNRPVRVRIINASNVGYLALRWPQMRHIEGQQGFLPALQTPDRVIIPPGGREGFEWLVTEPFTVETLPYSLNGGDALGDPTPLIEVQPASPGQAPIAWPWPFTGAEPSPDPGHTDLVFAFAGSDRTGQWLLNGKRFPEGPFPTAALGETRIVELRNVSPTEHPFHLHGLHFEVLSINDEPVDFAWWADTINVGLYDRVRLRLPVDNPGLWMTHCHILPHATDGMMTLLDVE